MSNPMGLLCLVCAIALLTSGSAFGIQRRKGHPFKSSSNNFNGVKPVFQFASKALSHHGTSIAQSSSIDRYKKIVKSLLDSGSSIPVSGSSWKHGISPGIGHKVPSVISLKTLLNHNMFTRNSNKVRKNTNIKVSTDFFSGASSVLERIGGSNVLSSGNWIPTNSHRLSFPRWSSQEDRENNNPNRGQGFQNALCPGQENQNQNSQIDYNVTYVMFETASGRMLESSIVENENATTHAVVVGCANTCSDAESTITSERRHEKPTHVTPQSIDKSYVLFFKENKAELYSCHEIDGTKTQYNISTDMPSEMEFPNLGKEFEKIKSDLTKALKGTSISLHRGHLVPAADFPYPIQQQQTNVYENIVPQWSSINQGHWKTVEGDVRNFARSELKRKLSIATGTWGELSRLLQIDVPSEGSMPVPALLWKLVYDPKKQTGVVIFVSNNPFKKLQDLHINPCSTTSVCNQLEWLSERLRKHENEQETVRKGEIICCALEKVNQNLELQGIINSYENKGLLVD